jgi:hypothetical protein
VEVRGADVSPTFTRCHFAKCDYGVTLSGSRGAHIHSECDGREHLRGVGCLRRLHVHGEPPGRDLGGQRLEWDGEEVRDLRQ